MAKEEDNDADFFADLISNTEDSSSRVNREVIKHLFSTNREQILMITDLDDKDLVWATAFQAELRFLVDDFITSKKLKEKCYKFMEDIYRMRISRRRAGRTELFDALKGQTVADVLQNKGLMNKLRGS